METENNRIDQWFMRGIGIISAGLFGMIFFLVFLGLNQDTFSQDSSTTELPFSQLGQEIGKNIWTFRVYDVLILLVLLILAVMGSYYLVNFEAVKQSQNQSQHIRRRY